MLNPDHPAIVRSQTLSRLHPEDRLMEAFGTLTPTVVERSLFFHKQWESWNHNKFLIGARNNTKQWWNARQRLRKVGASIGFQEDWDFMIRYSEMRTRSPEILSLIVLATPNINDIGSIA